jgi:hypothetical protein
MIQLNMISTPLNMAISASAFLPSIEKPAKNAITVVK